MRRVAIAASLEAGAPLVAVAPACTRMPYLPYVVATLGPLLFAAMWGLGTLASVSLAMGPLGVAVHYVAAATFFWGMDSLCGLLLFTQWRLATLWPELTSYEANISLTSWRYCTLTAVFCLMVFVQFIADWLVLGAACAAAALSGNMEMLEWYFEYWGAIMQWSEIGLISVFGLVAYADLAAWPTGPETGEALPESEVEKLIREEERERELEANEEKRKHQILRQLKLSRGADAGEVEAEGDWVLLS